MNFEFFGHVVMQQERVNLVIDLVFRLSVANAVLLVAFCLMTIVAWNAIGKYRTIARAYRNSGIANITTVN